MTTNHTPPAAILESRPAPWVPESEDFRRLGVEIDQQFNPARCKFEVARAIRAGLIHPAPPPPPPPADPAPGPEEPDTPPPHPCRTEDGRLDVAACRRAVEVARARGWISGGPSPSKEDTER